MGSDAIQQLLTRVAELARGTLVATSRTTLVIGVAVAACGHVVLSWQSGNLTGMQAFVLVLALFTGELAVVRDLPRLQGIHLLIPLALPLAVWAAAQMMRRVTTRLEHASDARHRMERYRAALQRDPRNVAAHVFLADSYLLSGDRRQAAREYRAALTLDPHEYTANLKLARLQRA